MSKKLVSIVSGLLVVGVLTGCPSEDTQQPGGSDCMIDEDCEDGLCDDGECREVECVTDEDCDEGVCEEQSCVTTEYRSPCEIDRECESSICLETEEEGRACSRECETDMDCSDDGSWTCQSHEEHGSVCQPARIPPTDGSTLCGAGGVSKGEGVQLMHCLAPYDQGSEDIEGEEQRIESGGFKIITE